MGTYFPGRPACSHPNFDLLAAYKGLMRSLQATLAARSMQGSLQLSIAAELIPLLPLHDS